MKPLDSDEEEAEPLGAKETEQRQRASLCIPQLSNPVEQLNPEDGEDRGSNGSLLMVLAEEDKTVWSQKRQSEAVNQLKSLLQKQCREIPTPLSPSEKPSPSKRVQQEVRSSFSTFQDFVPMTHNQSEYIQHLEAEVKFCKEELQDLKQRIRVVVVENEKLHSELRSKDESLNNYTIPNSTVNETSHKLSITELSGLQRAEHSTWKNELEQLKGIYQAQVESLESQIISLRKDLSVSQMECKEVKVHLRHKEKQAADALKTAGAPHVAGLCLKCAQHEAVLARTHTNLHVQAIDRLTKERDELEVALRAMQASQQEAQQREWSACLRVKQAVEMAEEANLNKARVEMQCELLSRELVRQREQLEQEAQALQERLAGARKEGRAKGLKQKEELAQTVSSLSQRIAELEGQLDRAVRDKSSLTKQLEDTLDKLTSQEQENMKVCVDLQHQFSQAKLKKDEAERELRELNIKTSRQMEKAALEEERLSSELVGCRQHLEVVQKDLSQWQGEALSLTEQLANAQRQLHLTRRDKECAERVHSEEMASVTASARETEKELVAMLQQREAQHLERIGEADKLLSSQNSLIKKLKEECCRLVTDLEDMATSKRRKVEQLTLEKQYLEETVKRLRARCTNLEEQCVQHGHMHQRMNDRLQQLDRYCQNSAEQTCELLAKQNQLMEERRTLTEEVLNLRAEIRRRKTDPQSS